MRIVVDTNAFVAAGFKPASACARILAAVREGRATGGGALVLVWDDATRDETRRVLERIPRLGFAAVADLFREEARFAGETAPEYFVMVEDRADRRFAALASAADAVLVTSDAHLLGPAASLPCVVETPGAFARRVGL
ncbi:PIN domain-containing protein [Salinarimonas ramus]|uniref:PIN domain-containing protein n=1 Tax=Salinarimonas ramus TaxID=690164 RepID=A0A917QAU9_9HYPH|nr:PIN domain-containing protein [Salinarimonas ramus]GGK39961.1 hypothetical protein GCM10011322_28910 [Salinarimonas ramus]